jgi:amidase
MRYGICRIVNGIVELPTRKGPVGIPVRPMIGTLWTAPPAGVLPGYEFDSEHLGNVDCPDLAAGNTVLLPIGVDGGLLALGDVHAVQGDGEMTGVAVEASAEVELVVTVFSREEAGYVSCPQINGDDFIGSMGCRFRDPVSENIRRAGYDLMQRLALYYGFTPLDAYHLLGQAGEIRVCQVLGDHQAALVRIRKAFLV